MNSLAIAIIFFFRGPKWQKNCFLLLTKGLKSSDKKLIIQLFLTYIPNNPSYQKLLLSKDMCLPRTKCLYLTFYL